MRVDLPSIVCSRTLTVSASWRLTLDWWWSCWIWGHCFVGSLFCCYWWLGCWCAWWCCWALAGCWLLMVFYLQSQYFWVAKQRVLVVKQKLALSILHTLLFPLWWEDGPFTLELALWSALLFAALGIDWSRSFLWTKPHLWTCFSRSFLCLFLFPFRS